MTAAIARFDEWADAQLERLRGRPVPDRLFTTATIVADFSAIWHAIGLARAIAKRDPKQALLLSTALGAESLIVNQGVKRLFRRVRPTESGDQRFVVRRPSTSSFPSGHASSAFFAATLLAAWDGRRTAPLWFGTAAVVGVSRAYVRIHHASDVVAGAATGAVLGAVTTRILRARRQR